MRINPIGEYPDCCLDGKEEFELLDFDFYRDLFWSVIGGADT